MNSPSARFILPFFISALPAATCPVSPLIKNNQRTVWSISSAGLGAGAVATILADKNSTKTSRKAARIV